MGLWCVRDVLARFPSCGSCSLPIRSGGLPGRGPECHRCVVLYFGVVDF